MPATYIDTLRHGDTQGGSRFRGSTDDPLTELGWQQMREQVQTPTAITNAKKNTWDLCISSPLIRCAAFAQELTQQLSIPLHYEKRFQEMHFGAWEGQSASELMESHEKELGLFWKNPLQFTPPDAEPLTVFAQRIMHAWHDIIQTYSGKRILLITHGGVIRRMLCHAQHQPLKNILSFQVTHAQVTHFYTDNTGTTHTL